nr:solute carrier family 23 member 3 isoform X4 [Vulpes vulpes]
MPWLLCRCRRHHCHHRCRHHSLLFKIPPLTFGLLSVGLLPGASAVFWLCSISWSWLLCSVPPTCSCFKDSRQESSLPPLPSSWPPASFPVVCLPSCKFGSAADLPGLLFLQAASCPGSILRVPCPCSGADPEATSGHPDPWKLEVALFCSTHWGLALLLILLVVVCSQHLGSCQVPPCPWRPASNSSPHTPIPVFRLFSVLVPVACVWIISALLGLRLIPLELAASPKAPWVWLPHPAEWTWPLLTPRALAAGISMALAASTSSLGCYALCGRLLQLPSPPPHACSRGLSLEGLGSVLAGMLGSPMGTASSFPNVGTVSLIQAGSRRVAHLAGLLCVGLGLSPRLAQLLTAIPLPVLGGVLGVTQAVVLSTGFSSFHLADIDSGRNVFIVGFSIFMALLLPRWLREAPVLMSTGWSPLDVLLRSLLTEPIFLAGLLGFLLENTIPGTRLERGLGQGMPSPFAAPKAQMPEKSREKGAKEYELPFPIQKLHPCIPQPLRCLCPLPEDPGNEEGGPSEPGETADLLPGFGEQCPESSRELGSQ